MRHGTPEPITPAEWEAQRTARDREVRALTQAVAVTDTYAAAAVEGLARLRLTALQRHRIYDQVRAACEAHELQPRELLEAIRCGLARGERVVTVFHCPPSEFSREALQSPIGPSITTLRFDPGSRW